ncbi:MAG TPA: hypothetical protein VE954_22875 [Oligoflexus sp.]|uniref:hypothetical protein n=1 Tax=Oligoflexus sp. TaxID=1971216 RepID=UPI002D667807|nr:hypothetical protein [Oligoflexus sp.]HYX35955.1 hypothetical protein [Oligoflexus sp.]
MSTSSKFLKYFLPVGMLVYACAPGSKSKLADIASSEGEIHTQVYRVTQSSGGDSKIVALMGPYAGPSGKTLKAITMEGCESEQEAYKVLGIDKVKDENKLFTSEEKTQYSLNVWDSVDGDPEIFTNFFGYGKQSIACKPAVQQKTTWYWYQNFDGTDTFYFPNKTENPDFYYRITPACQPLLDKFKEAFDPSYQEISFSIPDAVGDHVQDLACAASNVILESPLWGVSVNYLRTANFNFKFGAAESEFNNSVLLVTYRSPQGVVSYFPILSINGERLPKNSVRIMTDSLKANLDAFIEKVTPIIPPILTIARTTISTKDAEAFLAAIPTTAFYDICLEGAPAACSNKAYWATSVQRPPFEDGELDLRPLYSLVPAPLKTTEKTLINKRLADVVSINQPGVVEPRRFGFETCGSYSLSSMFGSTQKNGPIVDSTSLDDLKRESVGYTTSFRTIAAEKTIGCDYPASLVCNIEVQDEASLRAALSGTSCQPNAVMLNLAVTSDIKLSAPIKLTLDGSGTQAERAIAEKFASIKEIQWHGIPVKEGDNTRPPKIIKNYANPDNQSMIKLAGINRLYMEGIVLSSNIASMDQTALSLYGVGSAYLDGLQIRSLNPFTSFTSGIYLSNTRLTASNLSIDAANNGILSSASRVILRGRDNHVNIYRSSETTGIDLVHSLAAIEGADLSADYSVSLHYGSVLYGQVIKVKGTGSGSSIGFLYQNKASYALVAEKAEFSNLFADVYFTDDSLSIVNGLTIKSDLRVGSAICANVETLTDRICKKP